MGNHGQEWTFFKNPVIGNPLDENQTMLCGQVAFGPVRKSQFVMKIEK